MTPSSAKAKVQLDVHVSITIPAYARASEDAPNGRVTVEYKNDFVKIGNFWVKHAELEEAVRVLGYKPGPVYRNGEVDQALEAARRLLPLGGEA